MALRLIIQRRLPLTQGWPVCVGIRTNGLEMDFKLVDGWKFIESGIWIKASQPVNTPSLYNETEKQYKWAKKKL